MVTYNELKAIGDNETERMEFVRKAITEHENSELFREAKIANEYFAKQNTTIVKFVKTLVTKTGRIVPDKWSPNHKAISSFFNRFVTQENQYLLGNGVTWQNEATKKKLGKDFDQRLMEIGQASLVNGVAYGFYNVDHLEVFTLAGTPKDPTYFKPLFDENNGSMRAGIRFWRLDTTRPLRATLYEEDGYTEYAWRLVEANGKQEEKPVVLEPKRKYKLTVGYTEADGYQIYSGENYPSLPIIPLYGNLLKQSELIGLREKIDAYDLMQNGYINDLDSAQLYWIIKNANGADNEDLAMLLDQLHSLKAANTDADVQAVTVDIPYEAREAILTRLEKQLYKDYGALDTDSISNGAVTATQIKAAYEPMETKSCEYEACILDFLDSILELAGISGERPSFTRTRIVNATEEIQTTLMAATYLGDDYVIRKVLTLLGDGDKADEIIEKHEADSITRMTTAMSMIGGEGNGYSTLPNGDVNQRA